jgi:glycine/sarcosine N-methyltransferase
MSFYQSITAYYREIFPLNPGQVRFVTESFSDPSDRSLLDIGCGTGDLILELAGYFRSVTGIDLDNSMLERAREHTLPNVDFQQMDMLQIRKQFKEGSFDGIICFGNTLVHLVDPFLITDFLKQARSVLSRDGKLLLQIIHYDRILDKNITNLPTIETDHCRFERYYHYDHDRHLVDFETILTIKSTGRIIRNKIPLYPLRKSEIQSMLTEAGFTSITFYGNFKQAPLESGSIPLILEARGDNF